MRFLSFTSAEWDLNVQLYYIYTDPSEYTERKMLGNYIRIKK